MAEFSIGGETDEDDTVVESICSDETTGVMVRDGALDLLPHKQYVVSGCGKVRVTTGSIQLAGITIDSCSDWLPIDIIPPHPAVPVIICSDPCRVEIATEIRPGVRAVIEFLDSADRNSASLGYSACITESSSETEFLRIPDQYKNAVDMCLEEKCIAVCGIKDMGKSSFNRYLINRGLCRGKAVYYVECDLGQTEFTTSGCLSVNYVTEPILGPPCTHAKKPILSVFVGSPSPDKDPSRYTHALAFLKTRLQEITVRERDYLVIINTMGWLKDLGVKLLLDMLRLFRPELVIHLGRSGSHGIMDLSASALSDMPGYFSTASNLEHHLHCVESVSKLTNSRTPQSVHGIPAKKLRSALALSEVVKCCFQDFSHHKLCSPHMIDLTRLDLLVLLHNHVPPHLALNVLNGAHVALCHVQNIERCRYYRVGKLAPVSFNPPLLQCLGFGIIRGIDFHALRCYVSCDATILDHVNCLAIGMSDLPIAYIFKPQEGPSDAYFAQEKDVMGMMPVVSRGMIKRSSSNILNKA